VGFGVLEGTVTGVLGVVVGLGVLLLGAVASVRVIREYERGVVFRLGRLRPLGGPGPCRVVPGLERLVRVDLRVVTLTIPPQEVITRDNVPARVNAVVLFRVVDPVKAVMEVENFAVATSQIAQTTLRSLLDREDLDTVLAHRDPEPVMGAIHARPARDRA
jgi:regulator of protease activity HflC (stomatin/prohibitin superfamily)